MLLGEKQYRQNSGSGAAPVECQAGEAFHGHQLRRHSRIPLLESEIVPGMRRVRIPARRSGQLGKIELADEGTFFLDEVGDLPMALQAKLLRFLQERVIERIGGRKEIPVDVRIVCATHQNLKKLIEEGRFREDLYYQLSEIVITIPPLRERIGDAIARRIALKTNSVRRRNAPP